MQTVCSKSSKVAHRNLLLKSFGKKILAEAMGIALVWLIGGPLAGLTDLGVSGIEIILVDP